MKTFKHNSVISLLVLISFMYACTKEETIKSDDSGSTISADINGTKWYTHTSICIINDGVASIKTNCSEKENLLITFYGFSEGSHILNNDGNDFAMVTTDSGTYTSLGVLQESGEVNIFSINSENSKISGSFEFVAIDVMSGNTLHVTNGSFTNTPYMHVASPALNNELQVEINGEIFTATEVETIFLMNKIYLVSVEGEQKLHLSFPEDTGPGTYNFDGSEIKAKYIKNEQIELCADSGTLNIVKHDLNKKILTGSFNFSATDTLTGDSAVLNNGSFYVRY